MSSVEEKGVLEKLANTPNAKQMVNDASGTQCHVFLIPKPQISQIF